MCGEGRKHRGVLRVAFALAVVATAAFSIPAYADPPSHAPAHGWRRKHDPHYHGYEGHGGHQWPRDYGTRSGHCNRDEIGTVLGGVLGGAVGSTIGKGSDRAVAIVVGGVLGAVIGHEIGREMDERDRACVGHSLELADGGRPVRWLNESSGVSYVVTPLDAKGGRDACRDFRLFATYHGKSRSDDRRACRGGDGVWRMASAPIARSN